MKRPRRTTPQPAVLPPVLHHLVQEKLHEDYLAFASDTAEEDPKHFIARDTAAQQALGHLMRLAELAGTAEAEPNEADTLAKARDSMAHENKP
jgi:hypothetical protein